MVEGIVLKEMAPGAMVKLANFIGILPGNIAGECCLTSIDRGQLAGSIIY
jgi:hypothetical protein